MALCLSVCEFDVCGTKNYVFVVLRSNECDTNFTFCGNKHYMSLCNRLNKASTVHDVVYFTLDCANWFIQPTEKILFNIDMLKRIIDPRQRKYSLT